VIKSADWIIDLGPEGGDEGGYLVAEGTPEQVAANPHSCTGQFLRKVLPRFQDASDLPRRPVTAMMRSPSSAREDTA